MPHKHILPYSETILPVKETRYYCSSENIKNHANVPYKTLPQTLEEIGKSKTPPTSPNTPKKHLNIEIIKDVTPTSTPESSMSLYTIPATTEPLGVNLFGKLSLEETGTLPDESSSPVQLLNYSLAHYIEEENQDINSLPHLLGNYSDN
jgi:hypothetical protein